METEGRVLLVDDDATLLQFLGEYLEKEGFQVLTADRGSKALRIFFQERPDLVVLDVMMPGMDGWEVCARLRELANTPVIMLTAKTGEADKLRGFRLGVDDYITKPFSMAEMAARIRAVMARSQTADAKPIQKILSGPLLIDTFKREVRKNDEVILLTPTEFRLLQILAENLGKAVTRQELVQEVWGDYRLEGSSALRRYIWFLRQKIEDDPTAPQRVVTVRGYGYRLEP